VRPRRSRRRVRRPTRSPRASSRRRPATPLVPRRRRTRPRRGLDDTARPRACGRASHATNPRTRARGNAARPGRDAAPPAGAFRATSVAAVDVTADQTLVTDPAGSAMELAPVLGVDAASLVQKLSGTKRFVYVARQVTPATWRAVDALGLPGIFHEDTTRRV